MPYLRTCILLHPLERDPSLQLRTLEGRRIGAKTLGEAVRIAEELLRVKIVPHVHLGRRCHLMIGIPDRRDMPVGVSVFRGNESVPTNGDFGFPLLDSDTVGIGGLCD